MRTLDELGISPAPWVLDAQPYGSWITDQRGRYLSSGVGEFPNLADARLIAAAPRTYKAAYDLLVKLCALHVDCAEVWELRDALAAASGESEVAK